MKDLRKFIVYRLILMLIGSLGFFACNDDEFLEETPLDFYSPENSYVTPENFDDVVRAESVLGLAKGADQGL